MSESPVTPEAKTIAPTPSQEFMRGAPSDSPIWPCPSDRGVGGGGRGAGRPASEEAEGEGGRGGGAVGREEPEGQKLRRPLQERCFKNASHCTPDHSLHVTHETYTKYPYIRDEDQLGLVVEATLTLQGLRNLSKVQEDFLPTPAKNLRLGLPRRPPQEMTASDLSSETESDDSNY